MSDIKRLFCAIALVGIAGTASAAQTLHERLTALAQEITYESARLYPSQATQLGITKYDADFETLTEADRAAYIRQLRQWQQRLVAIEHAAPADASLIDRDDERLLQAQLTQSLNGFLVYQFDRKNYAAGAETVLNSINTQLQFLPVAGQDGAGPEQVNKACADIVARLNKAPAFIAASERLVTHPDHLFGVIGSETLAGASDLLVDALTAAIKQHLGDDSEALTRFIAARDATLAAIAGTKAYIDAHVAQWPTTFPMGRSAYDRMIRDEQLLPYSSRDLERLGEAELALGWAEEGWLTAVSQRESRPFGPTSGGGLAPGGPALIDYYKARIDELTRYVTEKDVVTVPAWLGTIKVVETPLFMQPIYPGASMNSPRLFAPETSGYYFITPPKSLEEAAAHLDMNEDFDRDRILNTGAHEAMPGHFLQLSIARRHPDFIRKIQESTVFQEGWAFYGERMFVTLGLYGDGLDVRLFNARWERVRGARAIVDVKLNSGEWSFDKATDFYARETSFSHDAAAAQVGSMAVTPGYLIAYTAGRLQLEQLLGDYQKTMGERGSLHDFHDRLLSYGSVPFAILGPELLEDLNKPATEVRAAANY
jgi:uncharacterized protein (DUF885 family)